MARNEERIPKYDSETARIERWRWMLEQNVPIIGGWMHRRIASALIDSAVSGNWLAAQSLAVVFALHEEEDVRRMAGKTLQKINYATGIDAVWNVWSETRHPELEEIALGYQRSASQPSSVRLLSLLRMDQIKAVTHGGADLVPPLVQACSDKDPQIAKRAMQAILNLSNPLSIDVLCQMWRNNRDPFLTGIIQQAGYVANKPPAARVLSALKGNHLEVIMQSSAEMVGPLVDACADEDDEIARRALSCLPMLQKQQAIDAFCALWSETRSILLEKALIQANYKAHLPERVRLLTALKLGQMEIARDARPSGLDTLLEATGDQDPAIQENAKTVLITLRDEQTREALVARVIESDHPVAAEAALAAGYAPAAPELRALFYFLTEQWHPYNELDFDQSMMRAIYEASPIELRQRIAAKVQSAGRTDYLTILAGVDYRARAEDVGASEAALLVRVLAENREYSRLWTLAPELALPFSLDIIRILHKNGWKPESEADWPIFEALVDLTKQPIQLNTPTLRRDLPLAIPRATIKVKGRINDAAFAPHQPVLAIATSNRKVVLWNFQTAAIERVLDDFKHSVGKVRYTSKGWLLAAERSNTQDLCSVGVFNDDETYQLCAHKGTVTVMEPLNNDRLLTAGRDQRAFIWDLEHKQKVAEKEYGFWARSAAVSPDYSYAALLHDRLGLVRLPDLSLVAGFPFLPPRAGGYKKGIAQNAAFSPDGKYILAGQHNGQVGMFYHTSLTQRPRKAVITEHSGPVRGVHFLPDHPIVVSAGAEGQIRFFQWPENKLLSTVYAPEGQLTSLRISDSGDFMATGTSQAAMVLWDLRVLDIPSLFSQPLATATHDQVTTVLALSAYQQLPEAVRNGLTFLRLLLQYRFRFDVHLEEAPAIQFGEFDILIED